MHWPYDTPAEKISQALGDSSLRLLSINTLPGNIELGEFGLGAVPGLESRAQAGIDQAIEYGAQVGAENIHVMAGITENEDQSVEVFLSNLHYAATAAANAGIGILIEPINREDRPGYFLHTSAQAISLIDSLREMDGIHNVRMMFDCYHIAISEGSVAARLSECLPYIGHVQIARVPDRHEPDRGQVDYDAIYALLDRLNYEGYIGAEYIPEDTTEAGLGWFQPWREPSAAKTKGAIYKTYTQETLDKEYDNRKKVENAAEHIVWYSETSEVTRNSMTSSLNLTYGNTADETLDLFFPNGSDKGNEDRPVHVFIHGGYWKALHKDDFSYVANCLNETNGICAVINYSLIPTVSLDQLVQQCQQSLMWLWQNISDYGGDRELITLSGHSAGGHLVARMIGTDWNKLDPKLPTDLIKGGISLSGIFDLEPIQLSFLNDDLQLDTPCSRRNSPVHLFNRNNCELVCLFGEHEGEEYRSQSESISEVWPNTDAQMLEGHDHFTIVQEMNQAHSTVSTTIRQQLGL
jgi:hydroxypyruvate isomerase